LKTSAKEFKLSKNIRKPAWESKIVDFESRSASFVYDKIWFYSFSFPS
jgi:hypothetical protein